MTLTGCAGSGKSTIARTLIERADVGEVCMLPSLTTRLPRSSDLPNEYLYVPLHTIDGCGDLLWRTPPIKGHTYATTRRSVLNALDAPNRISIMILVPESVNLLAQFIRDQGRDVSERLISFFVSAPSQDVVMERIRARGENPEEYLQRLNNERSWKRLMESYDSFVPTMITNRQGALDATLAMVVRRLVT